ncbi:MAG TPA: hypothetical protein PKA90_03000 [Ignavibacteria bacterium]|nr:hypothetical protein [Ignavibacteria bacterium]HMR39377.1 hypothetical protein [Ignavibacteria bacterium]
MKKLITLLFILAVTISLNNKAFSQANSVSLNGNAIYSNIEDAYNAITPAFVTPQLIEILSAYDGSTELFPITLNLIAGTSTITIRPAAGNNGETVTSSVINNYLFFLSTCNNVIIDGRPGGVTSSPANYLTINNAFNTATNGNAGAIGFFGADNCTVRYVNSTAALGSLTFTGARNINIAGATGNPSDNNIIENCVVRGGLRGIQNFGLNATTINHNSIIRNNDVAQFFNIGSLISNDSNTLIQNNKYHFTSAITTIATFLVGIQTQGQYTTVENNEVTGFTSLNASSYLHVSDFGANNTFKRNRIHSNVPDVTATNVVVGAQLSSTGTTLFTENEIYDLKEGAPGTIIGINVASNASAPGNLSIIKNRLYGFSSLVAARIEGMRVTPITGNTINILENNLSITAPNNSASGIFGIYASDVAAASETYTANVNSNSVYIGGVNLGTVGVFVNSAGIFRDNLYGGVYNQWYNNIVNERTTGDANYQYHLGFWLDTASGTLSLDSNNYYSVDPNLGFAAIWYDSLFTNADITEYRAYASPNEANTTFGNANFLSLNMNFEACPLKSEVTVELRESTAPYNIVETASGLAGSNFPNKIIFYNAADATPYYIVVKSANMIETWSASTVSFSANGASYDFTTSLAQAYGSNQKLSGGIPSVYQGDANQDGIIDFNDLIEVYNDAIAFVTSPATDFNCDGVTDVTDIILAANNASAFVAAIRPPGAIIPSVNNTTTYDNVVNSQRLMKMSTKPETSDANKRNINSAIIEN